MNMYILCMPLMTKLPGAASNLVAPPPTFLLSYCRSYGGCPYTFTLKAVMTNICKKKKFTRILVLSHWSEAKEYRSETGMKRIHFFVSTPLYMKTTDHCHKSILQRTQRLKSMKSLNCFAFFNSFRINKSWRQNLNRPFCDFRTKNLGKTGLTGIFWNLILCLHDTWTLLMIYV
ncbi:unnamed protein product [Brugia timori]|uniref:Secreted protein n=1 Tax=Brugia timori TaxID=42155 RepID=A0A0R3QNH2_9BILA|nr:unnamed protein product [Brugia timori]